MDDRSRETPSLTPSARILKLIEGEELVAHAQALDAEIVVTERRLTIIDAERVAMAIHIEQVRRIQFDIEKSRPAALVIVPESPTDQPAVLSVPVEHYEPVARALVVIGKRLAEA